MAAQIRARILTCLVLCFVDAASTEKGARPNLAFALFPANLQNLVRSPSTSTRHVPLVSSGLVYNRMVLAEPGQVFWKAPSASKEPLARGKQGLSVFTSFEELGSLLGGRGKADMVWDSLRKGINPVENVDVSSKARLLLEESFSAIPGVLCESVASDGTTKLLVNLDDGLQVEAVVIPNKGRPTAAGVVEPRTTLCVSSQVGCNRACDFCATGKMGFIRQLTTHEILSQVFHGLRVVRDRGLPPLHNIVFMGMGEPLNNPLNVHHATRILTEQKCFAFARAHVCVSSVGPSPAAIRAAGDMPAMLAWSVHAADDSLRKSLVPTTAHTMEELRDAYLQVLTSRSKQMSTFMVAITLIAGVNDGIQQAMDLAKLLEPLQSRGIKICVDLIPYNYIGQGPYVQASTDSIGAFQKYIRAQGLACFVRVTRGDDKNAACGQLATTVAKERK